MISWEDFKEHMHEVCLLIGQNPPTEQMQAIYTKVKDIDLRDFRRACNDDELLEELAYRRMNYPSLKRAVMKYQIIRLEKEHAEAKRRETEELKESLRDSTMPEEIRVFIAGFGNRDKRNADTVLSAD